LASHRPYIDPTSALHLPYIDHTSTLYRPCIGPTSTLLRPNITPICRRKNINVFKPFILGHLWLNIQSVDMPYKHKRDCPLCNKPGLRFLIDHLRQVQNLFSFEYISFLWSFCEASAKLLQSFCEASVKLLWSSSWIESTIHISIFLGYQYLRISIS
jgi:hypothetical protein